MKRTKYIFDLAMTVTFLVSISLPLFFTHNKKESWVEKRQLAEFPEVTRTREALMAFPIEFEQYYDDHFGFREQLTYAYNLLNFKLGVSPSSYAVIGKGGWFFYAGGRVIEDYRNSDLFTDAELAQWKEHLEVKYYGLQAKGIEYAFVIAPNKNTIYGEYMPSRFRKVGDTSRYDQLVEYMRSSEVPVIDLRPALLNHKHQAYVLYDKTGTHWNAFGASIAQQTIAEAFMKKFPEVVPKVYTIEQFTLKSDAADRGIARMMNLLPKFNPPSPVLISTPPACQREKLDPTTHHRTNNHSLFSTICSQTSSNLNALVFRDSFFIALQPYFSHYFSTVTYTEEQAYFLSLEQFIEDFHYDIVVEERVERRLKLIPKASPAPESYFHQIFLTRNVQ